MPPLKSKPQTEVFSTRVPKTLMKFFKTLENRNDYVLQLIENSKEYQEYLRKQAEEENKNQPSLFS
ncbi:TPA: hypothetical protein ACOS24_001863 [Campylobacter coli]